MITSLDKNSESSHAVLAGYNILKTIRVDGTSCEEETNIRAALIDQDVPNAAKPLDISDVKWSHGQYSSYIATAASTGVIVLYDLAAQGIETWRVHEHHRQVHKLAFNPHSAHLLLSASSDGSVLLWDIRDNKSAARFISRKKFKVNSGAVRDVKWSPTDGTEFAFSTDLGSVQKWDYRNNAKPKLRINAHGNAFCGAIDWHPDGKHLMSAGHDRTVKVWDFSSESRRQKERWIIRTPHPVANARWRPEFWSAGDRGDGSWQCTQLVTSYDAKFSPVVHLWDLKRPYMPRKELRDWAAGPSDMLWKSQRLLWVVDRDGGFQQADVAHASKIIDRRPMSTFALSPTGEICVFSQKRPRRRPSLGDAQASFRVQSETTVSYADNADLRKSLVDEEIDENLLSTSYRRSQHRPASTRSGKSASSTPPAFPDSEMHKVTWLSETLSKSSDQASQTQVAYRGFVSGTLKTQSFTYLAQKYKTSVIPRSPTVSSYGTAGQIFECNALYAQKTGAYRVAQTWRVFSAMITQELKQRAIENRRRRLISPASNTSRSQGMPKTNGTSNLAVIHAPNISLLKPALLAAKNMEGLGVESSSNVQTPIAKPHGTFNMNYEQTNLPNPDQEVLELPPSLIEKQSVPLSRSVIDEQPTEPEEFPVFQESQWAITANEINARKAQMQGWRANPRPPIEFDCAPASPGTRVPPRLDRHNSDDSFGMFSASSGSQLLSASFKSQVSVRGHRPSMSRISESGDQIVSQGESELYIPPNEPLKPNGYQHGTKLSWLTSSSSMDFGGRDYSLGSEVLENQLRQSQIVQADDGFPSKHGSNASCRIDQSAQFLVSDFDTPIDGQQFIPVSATKMLQDLYRYYTNTSPNAQAIYHIATILKPLLTQAKTRQGSNDAGALLISYDPVPGINQIHTEAVLSTYHDQLQRLQIYNPSVTLTRDVFEDREILFDQSFSSSQVGLICLDCSKPINNPISKFHCESCGKRQANCPICWQKYPAFQASRESRKGSAKAIDFGPDCPPGGPVSSLLAAPPAVVDAPLESTPLFKVADVDNDPEMSPQTNHAILWQSCLICGHGAHAACLQHVQNDPKIGGKCPTDGCLCDCIPGTYRKRLDRETDEVRRKSSVSWVRGDTSSVGVSPAVKGARSLLDRESRESFVSERIGGVKEEKRVRVVEPTQRRG